MQRTGNLYSKTQPSQSSQLKLLGQMEKKDKLSKENRTWLKKIVSGNGADEIKARANAVLEKNPPKGKKLSPVVSTPGSGISIDATSRSLLLGSTKSPDDVLQTMILDQSSVAHIMIKTESGNTGVNRFMGDKFIKGLRERDDAEQEIAANQFYRAAGFDAPETYLLNSKSAQMLQSKDSDFEDNEYVLLMPKLEAVDMKQIIKENRLLKTFKKNGNSNVTEMGRVAMTDLLYNNTDRFVRFRPDLEDSGYLGMANVNLGNIMFSSNFDPESGKMTIMAAIPIDNMSFSVLDPDSVKAEKKAFSEITNDLNDVAEHVCSGFEDYLGDEELLDKDIGAIESFFGMSRAEFKEAFLNGLNEQREILSKMDGTIFDEIQPQLETNDVKSKLNLVQDKLNILNLRRDQ